MDNARLKQAGEGKPLPLGAWQSDAASLIDK